MKPITIALIAAVISIIISVTSIAYSYSLLNTLSHDMNLLKDDVDTLVDIVAPGELALLRAAKQEGKVVFYSTMVTSDLSRYMAKFRSEYPWLEVEFIRGGSSSMTEKVVTEIEAGEVHCDVFSVMDVSIFLEFKEEGHLMYYNSSQYQYYRDDMKDPGYWAAWRGSYSCIMYNTEVFEENGFAKPTSWQDLLKPEYSGQVIFEDPRAAGDALAWYYTLRELHGIEFWETMKDQNPTIETGTVTIAEKISTGEKWIGYQLGKRAASYRDELQAPVDAAYPEEGISFMFAPVGIIKDAPHPNAAKFFLDWLLGEGSKLWEAENLGEIGFRIGVPEPVVYPEGIEVFVIDWNYLKEHHDDLTQEFAIALDL